MLFSRWKRGRGGYGRGIYRIVDTILFYDVPCIGIGKDDFKGIIATDDGGLFLFSKVAVHDFFNAGSILIILITLIKKSD